MKQKKNLIFCATGLIVALASNQVHATLWIGSTGDTVSELNENTGTLLSSFSGTPEPVGVQVDSATGQIYVGHGNTSIVTRYNLDGTGEVALNNTTASNERHSMALDTAGGRIFYTTDQNGVYVSSLDGTGGTTQLFDPGRSQSVFYNPINDQIYFNDMNSGIWTGNADGTGLATQLFSGTGFRQLTVDTTANRIYWTDFDNGNILGGDISGVGAATTVFSGLSNPWGIDVDPLDGILYWSEISGNIYSGNVNGTNQALLTNLSSPRGVDFVSAVPEPVSILLYGVGIVGLVGSKLRRKK